MVLASGDEAIWPKKTPIDAWLRDLLNQFLTMTGSALLQCDVDFNLERLSQAAQAEGRVFGDGRQLFGQTGSDLRQYKRR